MTTPEVDSILNLVHQAGAMATDFSGRINEVSYKEKESAGLVSEADEEVESFLSSNLVKLFPGSFVLGEEDYAKKQGPLWEREDSWAQHEELWIIDPIDGTNNFLSGFDYYSISVAFVKKGEVVFSSVLRPGQGHLFVAEKGKGAYMLCAGEKKRPGDKQGRPLKSCLAVTGFAAEKGERRDQEFTRFKSMAKHLRGIRRMGCASLDMAYTCFGPWDIFWESGLPPWDTAAGFLLATESGLNCVDYSGNPFNPFTSRNILVGHSGACKDWISKNID